MTSRKTAVPISESPRTSIQGYFRSRARVGKYGEVFTDDNEVMAMLDLVEHDISDPSKSILEPAAGHGNFLMAILKRRIKSIETMGLSHDDHNFELLIALSNIYAVDIMKDNVAEARARIRQLVQATVSEKSATAQFYKLLDTILQANIICADFLQDKAKIFMSKWIPDRSKHAFKTSKQTLTDGILFDVVMGNPPYQKQSDGRQKTHIWHHFVVAANKVGMRVCMIHPSGWVKGGIRLNIVKQQWAKEKNLQKIILHEDRVFQAVSTGPTTITLFDNSGRQYDKPELEVYTITGGHFFTSYNYEDARFYKNNDQEEIDKIIQKFKPARLSESMTAIVSAQRNLGITGRHFKNDPGNRFSSKKTAAFDTKVLVNEKLLGSNGRKPFYYINVNNPYWDVRPSAINKWKVAFPATGVTQWNNNFLLKPRELCTDKYLMILFDTEKKARRCRQYLGTKFFAFAHRSMIVDQNALRKTYRNIPIQDFSDGSHEWNDSYFYRKYELSDDEVKFIESRTKEVK